MPTAQRHDVTRRGTAARLAVLFAVVLVAYWGTFRNGFVWDDFPFILHNPVLKDLRNLPAIFASDDAVGTWGSNAYYRPLTTATFALDHRFWGENPAGYHATNLFLHLAVCAALFLAVRRMTADSDAAFVSALLFSVHPAHAEPVGFISARADLLCGLFMLCAFLAYLDRIGNRSRRSLPISLLAFSLALLSKIVALALPPLIALHLLLFVRKERRWGILVPYAVVALAYLAIRASVVDMGPYWGTTALDIRLAQAGPVLAAYVRHALLPTGLQVFYDMPLPASFFTLRVVSCWGIVAAAGALALALARRHPGATFGAAWFFAGLLPVCGIVMPLYPAPMADRYLYIPLIGAATAAGWAVAGFLRKHRGKFAGASAVAVTGVLAAACAASTMARLPAWGDPVGLWRIAERENPGNAYVLRTLGSALATTGSPAEAKATLERAIALRDDDARTHVVMARIGLEQGKLDEAERHLWRAMALGPTTPGILAYMGMIMGERGIMGKAEELFREALRMDPGHLDARMNLERLRNAMAASGRLQAGSRHGP